MEVILKACIDEIYILATILVQLLLLGDIFGLFEEKMSYPIIPGFGAIMQLGNLQELSYKETASSNTTSRITETI